MSKTKEPKLLRDMDTPMVLGCVELDRTTLTPVRRPIRPTKPPEPVKGSLMIVELPEDPAPHSGLLSSLQSLSSGTLSAMTKETDYTKLDSIHQSLIVHYLTNYDPAWTSWIDVWWSYKKANE